MNNPVLVRSKTTNNRTVSVAFQVIEKPIGDDPNAKDIRTLSRTYTFENFEARMPIKMAKILIKKDPEEFSIIRALVTDPQLDKEIDQLMGVAKRKAEGYNCDRCDRSFKSSGALQLHIYNGHIKKEKQTQ